MGYAAYVTATGVVDSLHRTEDSVDARLSADSTLSKTGDVTFPEFLKPETWLWNSTDSKFEEVREPSEDIDQIKNAAYGLYAQLAQWQQGLDAEAPFHPTSDVQLGHDFLAYAYWGAYHVVRASTYTKDQKVTFCEEMAKGAADVTTPFTFFEKAHEITDAQKPGGAVVWVNPSTGVRMNLSAAEAYSATLFTTLRADRDLSSTQISDAAWIEALA